MDTLSTPATYDGPRLTEAQQKLVADNLRLAAKVASKFSWAMAAAQVFHGRPNGLAAQLFDDFYQAGTVGLCVAATRYEPERGWKFSTYAQRWIIFHIMAARLTVQMTVGPKSPQYWRKHKTAFLRSQLVSNKAGSVGDHHNDADSFDVWDDRSQDDEEAPTELTPELAMLLSLTIDEERWVRFVRWNVIDERSTREIGREEGVTRQCVSQILAKALRRLRSSPGFMQALHRQVARRRLMNREDFRHMNIGTRVA